MVGLFYRNCRYSMRRLILRVVNGRRGAFQMLFGMAYTAVGLSYIAIPASPGRAQALSYLPGWAPPHVIGSLWLVAAVVALWGSHQPRPRDKWGFIALVAPPALWGFLYMGAVVHNTNPHGWVTSALYWCIAGAVMVASGMSGDSDTDLRRVRVVIK